MNSTKLSVGVVRAPRVSDYVECPKPWLERERFRNEGRGRYAEIDGPPVQVLPRSTVYLMVKP